jgi:hypothetical protein
MANGDRQIDPDLLRRLSTPITSDAPINSDMLRRLQIPVTGQVSGVSQLPPVTFQKLVGSPQEQQSQSQEEVVKPAGKGVAAVRYNNPGAMWDGPSATKFGSTSHGVLSDGNHIAYFPDKVSGAAAQFDLLNSRKYIGRPIGDVIDEWSGSTGGEKNVHSYAKHVADSVGLSPNDPLTPQLLQSPAGITFAKAMARIEAGGEYPLSDDEWNQAQQTAFGQAQKQLASAQSQQPPETRRW